MLQRFAQLNHSWQTRLRDGAAAAFLLGILALFLGPALRLDRVLLPLDIVKYGWLPWVESTMAGKINNPLISDVPFYIYPAKHFMAASLRLGEFPLWNPYSLGGYPFVYNVQAGLFYPFSLFYHFFPWYIAVDAVIIGQLILGAIFMYAYLRLLRLRRVAAVGGSLLFILNGHMVVFLEWQAIHAAVIWLPLALYAVEKMVQLLTLAAAAPDGGLPAWRRARRWALVAALAFALPWLGGHWNWSLYTSLTLLAYSLWRLRPLWCAHPVWRRRLSGVFLLIFVLGSALAMIQVWPSFSYLSQSIRSPLPLLGSLRLGLWDRMIMLLVPNFFGNPSHGDSWWGFRTYNAAMLYLGVLPLFLIAMALWLRRDTHTRFFAAWSILGLLWTLGPGYIMLYVLPVFNGLMPNRAAIVPVVCGSVLAALGLEALLGTAKSVRTRCQRPVALIALSCLVVTLIYGAAYGNEVIRTATYLRDQFLWLGLTLTISVSLLAAFSRGWLRPAVFGLAAIIWMAVDLFWAGSGYNTITPVADFYPENDAISFLQADTELYRIVSLDRDFTFPPNTTQVFGIQNISGYEPGLPQHLVTLFEASGDTGVVHYNHVFLPRDGLDSPLLDMLNVKYIPSSHDWWASEPVVDVRQTTGADWLALTEPAGQTFTAASAGLQRIDIRFRDANRAGAMTLRVYSADGAYELATSTAALSAAPASGWLSFAFEPISSDWGRAFRFFVTYEGDNNVALAYAAEDVYPAGTRLAGAAPVSGDLVFITHYLPRPGLVYEAGYTRIYLNENYLPRAYAVHQALLVPKPEDALSAVLANLDALDERVILETATAPAVSPPDAGAASSVRVDAYQLNEVVLTADMAAPGLVVLADRYDSDWQAEVDGDRTTVYQANYVVRAVAVPAGRHTVRFYYRPVGFYIAAAVSGLALLITLGATAWLSLRLAAAQKKGAVGGAPC